MSNHFNKLTPAEAERLAILVEECGEVIHMCGKILRHGYESYNPYDPSCTTNRTLLAYELGDLTYHIKEVRGMDMYSNVVDGAEQMRNEKVKKFTHHQEYSNETTNSI